jgi:hypothetical protein
LRKEKNQTRLWEWEMTPEELTGENGFPRYEQNIGDRIPINQVIIPGIGGRRIHSVLLGGTCDRDAEHGMEFLLKKRNPLMCFGQVSLASGAEWDGRLA